MPFVLQPRDFDIVQSVFKSLIGSEWFDRTDANEKACAQLVLALYGKGGIARQVRGYGARTFQQTASLNGRRRPPRVLMHKAACVSGRRIEEVVPPERLELPTL